MLRHPAKPCGCRCPPNAPTDEKNKTSIPGPPYPLPIFVPQNQTLPDIHPGKYGPLPMFQEHRVVACEWQSWSLSPPLDSKGVMDAEFPKLTFEQGQKDAAAWCDANGYPAVGKNNAVG